MIFPLVENCFFFSLFLVSTRKKKRVYFNLKRLFEGKKGETLESEERSEWEYLDIFFLGENIFASSENIFSFYICEFGFILK